MRINLLFSVMVLACCGCAAVDDYHYCWVHGWRADSAWRAQHNYQQRWELSSHYAKGWKAGYFDVSTGGCGETPAVPPPAYWSPQYQSEAGQAAIEDWFTGFQDGATAAQSSGLDAWHPVPTSPEIPTGVEGFDIGTFDYSLSSTHQQDDFLHSLNSQSESHGPVPGWPSPAQSPLQANLKASETLTQSEPSLLLPAPAEQPDNVPPVVTEE